MKYKADVSLLFVAFVWGATFVVVQNAIAFLPPLMFNGVRFAIASVLLWIWVFIFERKPLDRQLVRAGLILGIWLCLGYAFQTIGLLYTTSSKAGFITGLNVVIVPFLSFIILKQKPSFNAVVGSVLATCGLYLLTTSGDMSINKGDVFIFLCAIAFALHIVTTSIYATKFSSILLTTVQVQTVSIVCFICSYWLEDWSLIPLTTFFEFDVWMALLITALFATTIAFFIQTHFQQYTSPTRVALIFALEPVFAALTAYIWNDERLQQAALFGAGLILLGMVLSELPQHIWQRKKSARLS
ncbi:drug/metabolite transporter (DMT)-like permease [Anoxybacillus mongoliensis]|uniref:Drug/metabolite transporter (DMT)-like permease n=1 Tax=Anoxybacillus mongoliensis TaxID=452565 RepID=A0A7W8N8C9_9BACL|nr:DMT family transporter [Anoxybacillus mongoliensis]MBB5356145.1 drug/metabolite transporter (DMT)-like permease [Anoxybacillus mongoliensis]MCX8001854.1 DMT family transporter [Anoxybacillus mongoliensis]